MTNWELYQKLLEIDVDSCSFTIVNDDMDHFNTIAVNYEWYSCVVYTEKSLQRFIKLINNSNGLFYILNQEYDNPFIDLGGSINMYQDISLIGKRQRKLGKINYEIFKKRIISAL